MSRRGRAPTACSATAPSSRRSACPTATTTSRRATSTSTAATRMQALLDLDEPPTAVFAAGDLMAAGASGRPRSAACAVPDDVALVGFDDIQLAPRCSRRSRRSGRTRSASAPPRARRSCAWSSTRTPHRPSSLPVELVVRDFGSARREQACARAQRGGVGGNDARGRRTCRESFRRHEEGSRDARKSWIRMAAVTSVVLLLGDSARRVGAGARPEAAAARR